MKYSIAVFLLAASTLAAAQTGPRYVTDNFEITMRSGQGTSHKILKMLPTGKKVELLEVGEDGQYARVRTADGTEGWVLKRYLDTQPVAAARLSAAERRIDQMKSTISQLRSQVDQLTLQKNALSTSEKKLQSKNQNLEKSLSDIRKASSDVIAINQENKKLKSQLLTLRRNIQTLQQENATLQDSAARDWFMVGAAVLIGGVILGLILPNLRFRRKSSWGSL